MSQEVTIQSTNANKKKYQCTNQLGKGTFGTVFQAYEVINNKISIQKIAIKIVSQSKKDKDDPFNNMIQPKILTYLKEKTEDLVNEETNILKMHEYFAKNSKIYMVLQYCQGCLQSQIKTLKQKKQNCSFSQTLFLFKQIIKGVSFLHGQKICHRDLKPSNIFIANHIIKIGDFGTSKLKKQNKGFKTKGKGSPQFIAPQIVNEWFDLFNSGVKSNYLKNQYTFGVDIWSIGVILSLLTGYTLFNFASKQSYSNRELLLTLKKYHDNLNLEQYYKHLSKKYNQKQKEYIIQLIQITLQKDPSKRKTADQIYEKIRQIEKQSPQLKIASMKLLSQLQVFPSFFIPTSYRQKKNHQMQKVHNIWMLKFMRSITASILQLKYLISQQSFNYNKKSKIYYLSYLSSYWFQRISYSLQKKMKKQGINKQLIKQIKNQINDILYFQKKHQVSNCIDLLMSSNQEISPEIKKYFLQIIKKIQSYKQDQKIQIFQNEIKNKINFFFPKLDKIETNEEFIINIYKIFFVLISKRKSIMNQNTNKVLKSLLNYQKGEKGQNDVFFGFSNLISSFTDDFFQNKNRKMYIKSPSRMKIAENLEKAIQILMDLQ